MQRVVLVADLARCHTLGHRLGFCRSAVLVRTANVQRVEASTSACVAHEDIRGEYGADDVSEVGHVVHIRQGTCNQQVPRAFFRQAEGSRGRKRLGLRGKVEEKIKVKSWVFDMPTFWYFDQFCLVTKLCAQVFLFAQDSNKMSLL